MDKLVQKLAASWPGESNLKLGSAAPGRSVTGSAANDVVAVSRKAACASRRIIGNLLLDSALCAAIFFMHAVGLAWGQQLPIHCYDVQDGLAHSSVHSILQDSKGYLWFGTWEGLSRFDGTRFTNYGTHDGLGDPIINDLAEDPGGHLWVATNGDGVSLFIDDPQESPLGITTRRGEATRRKFASFPVGASPESNRVNTFLFDSGGNLWCATDAGLYRAAASSVRETRPSFEVIVPHSGPAEHTPAFADRQGRLWFGLHDQLIEVTGGRIIKYAPGDGVGSAEITSISQDRNGRVIVANLLGVFEFMEAPDRLGDGKWNRLGLDLRRDQSVHSMLTDSTGAVWFGTANGLIKRERGRQALYTSAQGLSNDQVMALFEDRAFDLWIGTDGGVCKLSMDGIVRYTRREGLPDYSVTSIFEDNSARVYAQTVYGGDAEIVSGKVVPIPESQTAPFNATYTKILQDRKGQWWVGTPRGLYRFPEGRLRFHEGRKLTEADGIPEVPITALHESPAGRLWVSSYNDLYWIDPLPGRQPIFRHLPTNRDLPFPGASYMISDPSGALWFGKQEILGRVKNATFELMHAKPGLPETNPRAFYLDSRGWLWIGLRYGGVSMTKDPTASTPEFVNYSTANGLASSSVWSISEDNSGRMYFATGRGLDRLDPRSGNIRHFDTADGLTGNQVRGCMRDSRGNIWIATTTGLSMLNPIAEHQAVCPPPVYLNRIQAAGEEVPISETGRLNMTGIILPASRNSLLIGFLGLDYRGVRELRYQYRLEGLDADWTQPTDQRSVNYGRLPPGSYRFQVRAINRDGMASPAPAVLEFRILRPVWQQWWFLTLMTIATGLSGYAIYRLRVARFIEIARVRTRIASDLHDDIGANLSKIAILSEVANQQLRDAHPGLEPPLSAIARISRESVASMSDVVWAINPARDSLVDLTRRMREFASDTFTARNIAFEFRSPSTTSALKMGTDLRRTVYLIFKEAVNNIVRHSECTSALIDFHLDGSWFELKVSDNGMGFDPGRITEGNGLLNMRKRAEHSGGGLNVRSSHRSGTVIVLRIPVRRRPWPEGFKNLDGLGE